MLTLTYVRVAPDVAEHTVSCQQHAHSGHTAFLHVNVPPVIPPPAWKRHTEGEEGVQTANVTEGIKSILLCQAQRHKLK